MRHSIPVSVSYRLMLIVAVFAMSSIPNPGRSATLLYKSYVVRHDRGHDILCDPYIVQKNDHILKLFRARGEIAQADFPEFLMIFRRLNPQLRDIDLVQPGEHIFIPLKKLDPNTLTDQQNGVVTIPFVSLSSVADMLKQNAANYTIQRGDTVTMLLNNSFGEYGTKNHQEGLRLFRLLNPDITDLNHIVTGQSLTLPNSSILNQPWYASLFDAAGNIAHSLKPTTAPLSMPMTDTRSALQKAADLLEAQLINKGNYFFPRIGMADLKIDLSKFPVFEFSDSRRVMIALGGGEGNGLTAADELAIKAFWQNFSVLSVQKNASIQQVLDAFAQKTANGQPKEDISFMDKGVNVSVRARWWYKSAENTNPGPYEKERMIGILPLDPETAFSYPDLARFLNSHGIVLKSLSDHPAAVRHTAFSPIHISQEKIIEASTSEAFVVSLMASLDIGYAPKTAITFPYGKTQITAVANLIYQKNGRLFLVDFGNLYGDAATSIEAAGIRVIHLAHQDSTRDIIEKLLSEIGLSFQPDPIVSAIPDNRSYGVEFKIPGYLISKKLLSLVPLEPSLAQFLNQKGYDIYQIGTAAL